MQTNIQQVCKLMEQINKDDAEIEQNMDIKLWHDSEYKLVDYE